MPEQALKREVVSLRECDLFCRLSFFAGDMDFFASPATINMPVRNSPVTPPAIISGALGAAAILEATTRPIVPARAAWAPINWQPENTQVKFDSDRNSVSIPFSSSPITCGVSKSSLPFDGTEDMLRDGVRGDPPWSNWN